MDKLPLEVLHRVFIQLPWTQRKECILVCRQWTNIMKASDLLCNNSFYIKSKQSLSKFLAIINQKPELAIQVEYLTIKTIPDDYDTRRLLNEFPNLKKVMLTPESCGILKPSDYFDSLHRSPFELNSSTYAGIEYLQDFFHCELTRILLSNGLCSRLETLVLNVSTLDETPSDLFPLLRDMPVLNNLTINNYPVTIDTCEMIHANIPSLKSLCLEGVDLLPDRFPENIQPALLVTRLDFWTYDHDYTGKINWLQYIHKKYTNIKHFNYEIDSNSYCRELKDVYSAEFPSLLQSIGPQLESLKLSPALDRGYQAIRTLGALDCRIKNLDMSLVEDIGGLDALAETSSFKYIENLGLSRIDIDVELDKLKAISNLKTLKIDFLELDPLYVYDDDQTEEIQTFIENVTIDMNKLFRKFPTPLESVSIGILYAKFDNEKKGENFDIKKLVLHELKSHGGRLDQFISNHLPSLNSLDLIDSFEDDESIMLPNHHFSHFSLMRYLGELNVRFVTKDKTRYFTSCSHLKKARSDLKNLLLPVSERDIQDKPFLTITCASVEKLLINGTEACLKSDKHESQSSIAWNLN